MTLSRYQEDSREFASTKNSKQVRIINWALGLGGESGEALEVIKKGLFKPGSPGIHSMELRELLLLELGDVLFYLTQLAREFELDLEDVALENLKKLTKRKEQGTGYGN